MAFDAPSRRVHASSARFKHAATPHFPRCRHMAERYSSRPGCRADVNTAIPWTELSQSQSVVQLRLCWKAHNESSVMLCSKASSGSVSSSIASSIKMEVMFRQMPLTLFDADNSIFRLSSRAIFKQPKVVLSFLPLFLFFLSTWLIS